MANTLKEPFIRPNINNQGDLPDGTEPLAQSPDIWCAADEPVFDFQNVLAKDENYGKASEKSYIQGHDNYYYLRFKNGSEKPVKDMSAELYYASASLINWPSEWRNVPVEGQKKNDTVNSFDTAAPGAVAVARSPFLLPRALAADKSYCIIARLWSHEYPNDMPDELSPIYISEMLGSQMLWGEQNIRNISARDVPQVDARFDLSVPAESCGRGDMWLLNVHTENAEGTGIEIEVRNSRTDNNGKQIVLERGAAKEDMFIGRYRLTKGYRSQMSVYIYLPEGLELPKDIKFKIDIAYIVNGAEYRQSERLGLLNKGLKKYFTAGLNGRQEAADNMEGVIRVGEYTVCLRP